MIKEPGIYEGEVFHKRLRPFTHEFTYSVFYLWLDIDRLDDTIGSIWPMRRNGFHLFGFYDRDHGARDGTDLRQWVENRGDQYGYDFRDKQIYLLCYPRMLGYVFNPLSLYFIYDQNGECEAILYEVKNTFGDQHGYLLAVEGEEDLIKQNTDKIFHVSPFIQMDAHYKFKLRSPGDNLNFIIRQSVPEGDMLIAKLTGEYRPLTSKNMIKMFFKYPLMTLKVIAGIHYEAFQLWRKGAQYFKRPEPPETDVTE